MIKMKKILSAVIASSMLAASLAVPAFADYTEPDDSYDIVRVNMTFDDGTATNPIDGTPALKTQATDTQAKIFYESSLDTTKEFFFTFDFCFDNENGFIEIPKYKGSSNSPDKVGPQLKYSGTKLVTLGSKSNQELGDFTIGEWYTGEIEGRTGAGAQYTTFRLYKYEGGSRVLVQETPNFDTRNCASENRSINGIGGHDVSLDNVKLISENPDTITVTAGDEINAGQQTAADYTMTRLGATVTKYDVTWSLYDENNENKIEDGSVTMNGSTVAADISSPAQTVTLRAEAQFGNKTLYGTKQIIINAVDISDEKFDKLEITGPSEVKAGTSAEYEITATLAGTDVTDSLSETDVAWGIYDASGNVKNENINMSIENGRLMIDESVISQDIGIRASSASETVSSCIPVKIDWAESQKETVLSYDACETAITNTTLTDSWDSSKAYLTSDNITFGFGDQTAYAVTDVDVKFDTVDGHGLTLYNNNGSENSNIRVHNGELAQQTGGSSWTTILTAEEFDTNSWYHIEFLYLGGSESGYNVYQYNSDGTTELVKTMANCNRRNDKNYGKITFTAGLAVDNFKTALALPDVITVTAPSRYIYAGETAQFAVSAERKGLFMKDPAVTWEALDEDNLPIIDGSVTVNEAGLLTVDAMAGAQTLTVRASSANGKSGSASIIVQLSEVFSVTNVGVNEEGTKIVKLLVDKNLYYNDDVMFIIAIYDSDGYMKAVKIINTFGDRLNMGKNEVPVDFELPADFNSETDSVATMAWTAV